MIYDLMGFILLLVVGAIIFGVVKTFFSSDRRSEKELKKSLASERRHLQHARATLSRIAAGDSGNPALDAQIALETISNMELKELES